jgi:hypothetical protein
MTMNLDELIQSGVDQATRVLVGQKDAELLPTFVVQFKDRPPAIIPTPWSGDQEKIRMTEAIRLVLRLCRESVTSYLFWSEAWMATEDLKHPIGLAPRDREDRKEVVIVNVFDHKGGKMVTLEIERGPDGVVTDLVKHKDAGDYDRFEGRLYNLLKDD